MSRKLENWLDSYLAFVDDTEPALLFKKWTAIGVIGAALRRKCYINWGHITFYPNMFIVLVGPSGSRKGTALNPGYSMLCELGLPMAAEAITREALIRELKESNDSCADAATGQIDLHSSLTIFSQELTVFLGYNNQALMADLSDWYDCRTRWRYRTKNMGTDDITNVWVSLIGATTPELVQSTLPMDAIGGGLTSRIVFIYAAKKGKSCPAPFINPSLKALRNDLLADLESISMIRGEFKITREFMDLWTEWYIKQDQEHVFNDPRLAGYVERRPVHLMKLCMIFNAIRRDGNQVITVQDFNDALDLLTVTECDMPKVFGGIGRSPISLVLNKVIRILAVRKTITRSELQRLLYYDADSNIMENVLNTLRNMRAISTVILPGNSDMTITFIYDKNQNEGKDL